MDPENRRVAHVSRGNKTNPPDLDGLTLFVDNGRADGASYRFFKSIREHPHLFGPRGNWPIFLRLLMIEYEGRMR